MKPHTSRFLKLVEDTKNRIQEINAHQLQKKIEQTPSLCIIDVRENNELNTGYIPSAIHLSKGVIERDIEKVVPNPDTEIVVYCSGGFRCVLVADSLQNMGYNRIYSLENGLQGWINAGYGIQK